MSGSVNFEQDAVTRPELQRALEDLEKKILDRLGREREEKQRRDVWRTVGETLQEEGVGAVSVTVCVCVCVTVYILCINIIYPHRHMCLHIQFPTVNMACVCVSVWCVCVFFQALYLLPICIMYNSHVYIVTGDD